MQKIDADYNANIVMAESKMRWDPKFGMLILVPPPLNFLSLVLMPMLLITGKYLPNHQEKINEILSRISFFPIALCLYLLFLIGSVLMLPVAYLKGFILAGNKAPSSISSKVGLSIFFSIFLNLIFILAWLILGLPTLLLFLVFDTIKYFMLLYH